MPVVGTFFHQAHFYPRSPCGERPVKGICFNAEIRISIHALLAESDTSILHKILADWDFYPRSPCGERPPSTGPRSVILTFLSTLSLRRATSSFVLHLSNQIISIHALLAESDQHGRHTHGFPQMISIHALLAESDDCWIMSSAVFTISIHALLAESDGPVTKGDKDQVVISIHALLAESDHSPVQVRVIIVISIHALLAESDGKQRWRLRTETISIHALLAESDADVVPVQHGRQNFYPRSPCGERPMRYCPWCMCPSFLSTLSLRRATVRYPWTPLTSTISIHALLAESDLRSWKLV